MIMVIEVIIVAFIVWAIAKIPYSIADKNHFK